MISIIGAGPAGSYAAYLLAKQGHEVHVYEEHPKIGKPVQCTGIVTSSIKDIIEMKKEFIANTIDTARIYAPNNKFIELKLKPNYILDREKFDNHLANMAKKAGAKIHTNHKFEGIRNGKIVINGEELHTDYLIGADGPNSKVSQYLNTNKRQHIIGLQARVEKKVESNVVDFWLGMGEFAWSVTESGTISRVGLVDRKDLNNKFKELLRRFGGKVIERQGGIIPIYDPGQAIQNKGILTIGDAAGQVKATTYGGIIPGLIAAEELGKSLKDYEKNYKKRMKKELDLALRIRKMMNNFTAEDYNELVGYFSQNKIKKIIAEEDRDFPSRFIFKILLKEPRFFKFATKLV